MGTHHLLCVQQDRFEDLTSECEELQRRLLDAFQRLDDVSSLQGAQQLLNGLQTSAQGSLKLAEQRREVDLMRTRCKEHLARLSSLMQQQLQPEAKVMDGHQSAQSLHTWSLPGVGLRTPPTIAEEP